VVDQLRLQPGKRHEQLSGRDENEAYLAFEQGCQYAVYFPHGGIVELDPGREDVRDGLQWLEISSSGWSDEGLPEAGRYIQLETPGSGPWLALLIVCREQDKFRPQFNLVNITVMSHQQGQLLPCAV